MKRFLVKESLVLKGNPVFFSFLHYGTKKCVFSLFLKFMHNW